MSMRLMGCVLASAVMLSACSSVVPLVAQPGATEQQIVARLGRPEIRRTMEGGLTRLEYPGGPYGRQTWFVDVDAAGSAVRSEQVLTEENFNRITPGMARDAVRQRLGRPGEVLTLGRSRGVVWSYRFDSPFCQWFQVEIAADQTVRSTGYGEPPECDQPNLFFIPR